MSTSEPTTNVVNFSFEMKEFDDDSLSFEDTLLQTRFWLVEALHLIADDKMEFNEDIKKSLRVYNRYCKMADQKPLEVYSRE